MTGSRQVEFLVDGEWLKPLDGPPAFWQPQQGEPEDWYLAMGWMKFYHPKHGVVTAVPRHHICRREP